MLGRSGAIPDGKSQAAHRSKRIDLRKPDPSPVEMGGRGAVNRHDSWPSSLSCQGANNCNVTSSLVAPDFAVNRLVKGGAVRMVRIFSKKALTGAIPRRNLIRPSLCRGNHADRKGFWILLWLPAHWPPCVQASCGCSSGPSDFGSVLVHCGSRPAQFAWCKSPDMGCFGGRAGLDEFFAAGFTSHSTCGDSFPGESFPR